MNNNWNGERDRIREKKPKLNAVPHAIIAVSSLRD